MLSKIVALSILIWLLVMPAISVFAHDVKDPVCRMGVDSDTTRFTDKAGNKTFYFCSEACRAKFIKSPGTYSALAVQLEKADLRDYEVDLTSQPAIAGRPVTLNLAVRYSDTKQLVRDFETIHQKLMHLIMVSSDLAWFEHQHPVRTPDGVFHINWVFPHAGKYYLYADFTPSDGDNQVKQMTLNVGGTPRKLKPLIVDRIFVKHVGDCTIKLTARPTHLRMEQAALLTYSISDRLGRPITDMQPFIGMPGHLIALSADSKQYVHTHTLTTASQPSSSYEAVHVTPDLVTQSGPNFSFKLILPTGGKYKLWAQFMHHNRVITVPFTFDVADLWSQSR